MAASSVELVNEALAVLGAEPITTLTAEDSPTAATALTLYQPTLDRLLAEFPWRFATKRLVLSQDAETPPDPWSYQYTLPAATIRVIRTDQDVENFDLYRDDSDGTRKLYSNRSAVTADVVVSITDPGLLPAHFEEALVARLAERLAMPVTRRVDFWQVLKADALRAVSRAKTQDWNEAPARTFEDGDVLAHARYR